MWETLSEELIYNGMFALRGYLRVAHNAHEVQNFKRHFYANRLASILNESVNPEQARELSRILNIDRNARYPVHGGVLQRTHGIARHDALSRGVTLGAPAFRASTPYRTTM